MAKSRQERTRPEPRRRAGQRGERRVESWVSFQELKEKVSMADILGHYGLLDSLKQQKGGDELVGLCPFHQERRGSFHVSISKNAWQCFGCKRKGNILDFVAQKEGVDIRQAALLIQGWFASAVATMPQPSEMAPGATESHETPQEGISGEERGENKPLTFELKGLDGRHPYLKERGLTKATIDHFGLGYCSRGMMKVRVAIPIHNERGELVAYAGRWPGEPPEGVERYLLPSGFVKSAVVFNLHRAKELAQAQGLVVVEGFFAVFKLHQAGFANAVALMGSSLSERQRDLLVATLGAQGKIILLFDGDDAGRACQAQCLEELAGQLYVKVFRLPDGQQPDHLDEKQIRQLLASP